VILAGAETANSLFQYRPLLTPVWYCLLIKIKLQLLTA
jgi:hypothetical protein